MTDKARLILFMTLFCAIAWGLIAGLATHSALFGVIVAILVFGGGLLALGVFTANKN